MISKNIQKLEEEITVITTTYLSKPKVELNLCMLMQDVYDIAEKFAKDLSTDEELSRINCKAGCSTCCRVTVPALKPEAMIIKAFLLKTRPEPELDELIYNMHKLHTEIKYLEEEERILSNKECAFLNEKGACGIYPVRPLMCRSITSADASACKDAMVMLAMDEQVFIPMNIIQKSVMDTAFKSLAKALEKHGQNSKSKELTSAVLEIL